MSKKLEIPKGKLVYPFEERGKIDERLTKSWYSWNELKKIFGDDYLVDTHFSMLGDKVKSDTTIDEFKDIRSYINLKFIDKNVPIKKGLSELNKRVNRQSNIDDFEFFTLDEILKRDYKTPKFDKGDKVFAPDEENPKKKYTIGAVHHYDEDWKSQGRLMKKGFNYKLERGRTAGDFPMFTEAEILKVNKPLLSQKSEPLKPNQTTKKQIKDKGLIDSIERGLTRIDNFRVGQVVREWSKNWKRFVGEHIVVKKGKTHTKVVTIEPRLTVHEFANSYDKFNFLGNLTDVYTRSFKSDKDGPKQDHFYFEVQVPKGKTETFGGYAINSKNKESFKLVEKALETSSKSSKAQPKSKPTKKSAMGKKIDLAIGDLVDLLAITDSPKLKDKIEKALKDLKELKKMY
jgi:hypothetical protein